MRKPKVWVSSSPRLGYDKESTRTWMEQVFYTVYPQDEFILLGHLAFSHASIFQNFVSLMNCNKRLLVSPFDTRSLRWYMRAGFSIAANGYIPLHTDKCTVMLSYIPAEGRLARKDLAALDFHLRLRKIFQVNRYFLNMHGYNKSRDTRNSMQIPPGVHDIEALVESKI